MTWRTLLLVALILSVPAAFVTGCTVGWTGGEFKHYRRQSARDRAIISPALAADPAFARVTINDHSGGGVVISGEVDSEADRKRLQGEVEKYLGKEDARMNVMVRPPTSWP